MSRFILLNFEDFGLRQDITKTIQLFNPFCICCLDRDGPMFHLDKCGHSGYLEAFDKPQLKQFNQLVCLQCHSILKKIECFKKQIMESYDILLSGSYTNTTVNNKRLNSLIIQKVVDDLHLPPVLIPDGNIIDEDIANNVIEINYNITGIQNNSNIDENSTHKMVNISNTEENVIHQQNLNLEENYSQEMANVSNMEQNIDHEQNLNLEENYSHEIENVSNMEENIDHEQNLNLEEHFSCEIANVTNMEENINYNQNLNLEENLSCEMANVSNMEENIDHDQNLNLEENFSHELANMEENISHEQNLNLVNNNIKAALEILERNNQSFVTLGSQLQFLNGEHLSFLEPSLLSKEILTDIPFVPSKNISTDLENGLLNNSKSLEIEIDGPDKMFYDSLDFSPDLMGKDMNTSDVIKVDAPPALFIHQDIKPKTKTSTTMPKKERKVHKNNTPVQIRTVKLNPDELNRERVLQAQSDAYLRYKFRCETCIIGFNYKENLEDHTKRKHGQIVGDNVLCDICSQIIPTPGSITEHNYRHYTRYECVKCNTRYHTYDEAIRHVARNKCSNGSCSLNQITLKTKKMSAQLRKVKLKINQTRNKEA